VGNSHRDGSLPNTLLLRPGYDARCVCTQFQNVAMFGAQARGRRARRMGPVSCGGLEDAAGGLGCGPVARRGVPLLALVLAACCLLRGSAAAPLSVAMGIDLGTDNSVVALARKRGVDIVANEASQRSTPSIVSFGHDQRHVGEGGFSQRMMNLKNTIAEPKRLLAKRFSDPAFMEELKVEPYEVVEGEGGEVAVKVQLCGSERVFKPVQVIATLLTNLKKIAEADHEAEVVDVAISVPCFFTEHQRRAIRAAAEIAGLKCLRLINDNTATALAYGITKTDLPEGEPRRIAFVDCGRDCMQVSIVAFKKGQLKVLSHAHSKSVGGRRIDSILFDHFAAEFAEKHKIDVNSQGKARLRLLLQCEKLKKTLSACPPDLESPLNVECLMNDMDVSSALTRQQLEAMLGEHKVFDGIAATCQEALTLAGITKEQLDSVELVGGTSRIPALRANIGGFFNKDCQTTINAAESVARGASLACAMDSPAFKVREFKVTDWNMYPVDVAYKSQDGAATGSISLKQGAEVPGAESLKLDIASPVSLEWAYTEDADVAPDVPRALASHTLKVSEKKGVLKQSVLAKVGFDNSGCVTVSEASLETQVEELVPPPKVKPPPAPATADKAGDAAGKEEGKDADAEMGEAKEEGDAGKGDKKVKKDKKADDKAAKGESKAPEKKLVTRREKILVSLPGRLSCRVLLLGLFCRVRAQSPCN
jgi:heat shock protein 4